MRYSALVIAKVFASARKSVEMKEMLSLTLNKAESINKGERSDTRLLKNKLLPKELTQAGGSSAVTDCDILRLFPEM